MKQPPGSIIQIAYVVRDIRTSVEGYARALGVKPFYLLEHVQQANPNFRGQAIAPDFSVALGFSGAVQIELIQQHCDTPSIYKEFLDHHGEGYHHVWRHVEDFDRALDEYRALGCEIPWQVESVGFGRCAYIDTLGKFGAYIELLEWSPRMQAIWEKLEVLGDRWDGREILLPMPQL